MKRGVDDLHLGVVLVGAFYVLDGVLGGVARWHHVAGGQPATAPLARAREQAGPSTVVGALSSALVVEADALVLGDERGPVLHLLVRDGAVVSFLDVILEAPARGVLGQFRCLGVVPLANSTTMVSKMASTLMSEEWCTVAPSDTQVRP